MAEHGVVAGSGCIARMGGGGARKSAAESNGGGDVGGGAVRGGRVPVGRYLIFGCNAMQWRGVCSAATSLYSE